MVMKKADYRIVPSVEWAYSFLKKKREKIEALIESLNKIHKWFNYQRDIDTAKNIQKLLLNLKQKLQILEKRVLLT